MNRAARRAAARDRLRGQGAPFAGTGQVAPSDALARALAHHRAGRLAAAEPLYRQALAAQPENAELLHLYGLLHHETGRAETAAELLGRAIELDPGHAGARNNLANLLFARGEVEAAIEHYGHALAAQPDDPDTLLNLGHALAARARHAEALDHYRRAAAVQPALAAAHFHAGDALWRLKRGAEAEASYRAALRLDPALAAAHYGLGNILFERGEADRALAAFRAALEGWPHSAAVHTSIGTCLQLDGRFDDALACFERALALDPHHAEAHVRLVALSPARADDGRTREIEALLARDDLEPKDRTRLTFALAKCYDDRGAYDAAFGHYRRANGRVAAGHDFDIAAEHAFTDRLLASFDAAYFTAAPAQAGSPSELPVFIVGMPRSGTTLVEQILASHPQVHTGGERTDMVDLVAALPALVGSGEGFPESAARIDGALARRLAARYLDAVRARAGDALRITDKLTGNYLHLGLIWRLFPGARVIHCVRDPLDTCLSCYFQDFITGHPYAYDLTDLGRYYRGYERVMAHWEAVLPLARLTVRYEELVGAIEPTARAMLEFCALDWDPRCLAFHETERTVRTASLWQVRQPLYATSVGRWRHYERHLGPLKAALRAPAG